MIRTRRVAVTAMLGSIALFLLPWAAAIAQTISTTATPASVTLGQIPTTLGDSATLSGLTSPTGTITFTLTAPSSAVVDTETVTVNGNGTYTTPVGFTLPTMGTVAGTWVWNATYAGNNPTLSATSEPVVVSKAAPSLALTAGPTVTLGSGTPLTASAVLANGYFETGTITFTLMAPSSAVVDTETVSVNGNGTYTTPVGFVPAVAGTYSWTAVYSGDGNNLASASPPATESVVAPPSIAKVFTPSAIALNATTSLTFTITNPAANTVALNGVAFTDILPVGLTVASSVSTVCGGTLTTTAPTGITLVGATIAPSGQCQSSVTVTGTASALYTNVTGAVSSTNGGTGNTATATLTVTARPPVITKVFGAVSIPVNGTTSLSFTIANPNAGTTLTGVGFTDTLPAGLIVATPNGLTGSCGGGTITATTGANTISLSGAMLAASASCTFSVNVTGTAGGQQTNTTGNVTSNEGGTGGTANASLSVVAPPSIAKVFNPSTIALNATTSLTFTITNPAANTVALNGVSFADTLPVGLTVASSTSTVCGGTLSTTAPTGVTLVGATIAANSQCQFSVTVTGTTAGLYANTTGAVSSTNGGTGNTATATLKVNVQPPFIIKAFGAASIPLNGTTSLSFTISNLNAATTLTGVGFTDTLPAGLIVATPNGLTGSCGGGTITATAGTNTITLSGATLAASSSCTFSVNVTGTAGGNVTNTTSAVTSNEGGAGGTATAFLSVVVPPSIAKVFNPSTIALNATTSLTFTITDPAAGNATLTGVSFTDTLPVGLTVASSTSSVCGGALTTTAPTGITLVGATIAPFPGGCQFSVTVTATAAALYTNVTGAVSSTNGGTGNTATATLTVGMTQTVAKSFNPTQVPLNGTTMLTFTIHNTNAALALTGVALTDTLPGAMVVASAPNVTNTCGGSVTATPGSGTISLSGGTLAASASCTASVVVEVTGVGVQTNSVQVTSNEVGISAVSSATLIGVATSTSTAPVPTLSTWSLAALAILTLLAALSVLHRKRRRG